MGRHLRHAGVLATLVLLLLEGLVVESLLLLLGTHVGAVSSVSTRHGAGRLGRWHGRNIFGGGNFIARVDTILSASWFRSIETSL